MIPMSGKEPEGVVNLTDSERNAKTQMEEQSSRPVLADVDLEVEADDKDKPESHTASHEDERPPDIYDKFSRRRKTMITALVSYNAFISPMTASIFLPSVPEIARDLDTTPTIINITIAVFIIAIGTAPLIWSPFSGFYGRRPIYLASMPIMLVASIGVACCRTVPQLIVTRILQGMGSSSSLAVGAGSIGDVFRPTERSTAMGYFYSGALLGPSLSPLIGAAFTEYTPLGWRSAQYFIAGCAALSIALTYFFLPETLHEPIPHHVLCKERNRKFVPFVFNPLAILSLFCWWNICAISFISSAVLMNAYVVLVPISVAFGDQYGISNIMIIGTIFLASGAGNIVGSRIAGPMADATVRRYIAKRGYRRPEDRLRAAVLGLGCIMPISCIAYGWLLQTRAGGIAPPIVFMFIQGLGLMLVFTPVNTYAVDAMSVRSASVIAVNNWVRYLFSAAASAFVLPMAQVIGWGWSCTVAAALVWISFGILLLTIKYGHHWRESANKKYGYNAISEDEKHPPSIRGNDPSDATPDEEADVHSVGDEGDAHTDLPQRPQRNRAPTMRGSTGLERIGSGKLSRQRSQGSLPDAQGMLYRTASLTGPVVHGGG